MIVAIAVVVTGKGGEKVPQERDVGNPSTN